MIRKYYFMAFLAMCLLAFVAAFLEPAWEPALRKWMLFGFAAVLVCGVYDRLERIEGKLDAILKKSERV